ncbi:glycosyltransferase [Kordiimonas sp.]|uniref:glycosyltransferase n=1 Tax=Kordiimonas sp. TaxID=1970157 RepID=UPI003A951414
MRTKLKILHVFPSFEIGGAQRRLVSLINSSDERFQHSVYAMNGCYDALDLLSGSAVSGHALPPFPKVSGFAAMRACARLLDEFQPDLLVTCNWGTVEWNLSGFLGQRCPVIHIQDGFGPDEQAQEKLHRRLTRSLAYRRADAVVVPSHTLAAIARKNWGISETRLNHIPNGIDVARFSGPADAGLLASLALGPEHTIIGTVAALRPEKNVGRLIEAFAHVAETHKQARLVIVGDGIGMRPLKMLTERIGLYDKVIFTGNLERPEDILPAFDIFALSSDTEQMPLSVIEAMACGLPIVATDVGDVAQMVSRQNAPYVQDTSAPNLAKNINALLDDRATARRLGAANREKAAREFTLKGMVERYAALFLQLAGR